MHRHPPKLVRDVVQKLLVRLYIVGDAERGCVLRECGCSEDAIVRTSVKTGEVDGRPHVQMLCVSKIAASSIMAVMKEERIHIEDIQCPLAGSTKRDSAIDQSNQHRIQS